MMTFDEFKKKKMFSPSKSSSSVASETVIIPFPSKKKTQKTPPVFTIATDNVDEDNHVDDSMVRREDYIKWKQQKGFAEHNVPQEVKTVRQMLADSK